MKTKEGIEMSVESARQRVDEWRAKDQARARRENMNWIIVNGKRYDLTKLYEVPASQTTANHGVARTGVWITKSNQVIVGTYSIWESGRNDGTVVGQQYHLANELEIANLATQLDDNRLLVLVPIAEE